MAGPRQLGAMVCPLPGALPSVHRPLACPLPCLAASSRCLFCSIKADTLSRLMERKGGAEQPGHGVGSILLGERAPQASVSCRMRPVRGLEPGVPAVFSLRLVLLIEVGMDAAQADELLAAAAGSGGGGSTSSAPSEEGSPTTGGATARSVSYEDFRRMLLSQPPIIITNVGWVAWVHPRGGWEHDRLLLRAWAHSGSCSRALAHPCSTDPASNTAAGAGAGLGRPALSPTSRRRQRQDTDCAPTSSSEGSPLNGRLGMLGMPGAEPPSPINLMPRYELALFACRCQTASVVPPAAHFLLRCLLSAMV